MEQEKQKNKFSLFKRDTKDDYSEGRLLELINTVGNSLLIGVLFIICSIPVITLGTSLTSFYYAMIKSVRKGRGYPAKEFFASFKRNILKGIAYTAVLGIIGFLLLFNRALYIVRDDRAALLLVCLYDVLLVFWAAFTVWIFPVISRFNIPVGRTIVLTYNIAARYFYFTIMLIAAIGGTVWLCLKLSVGFTLIIPPFVCYFSTYIIERAFKRYIPKPSDDEDGWYYDGND